MSAMDVEFAWPVIEPLIMAGVEQGHGEFDVENLRQFIRTGAMQVWTIHDGPTVWGVVITELVAFPGYQVLRVVLLAGNSLEQWIHLDAVLESYALRRGCAFIEGWVRPGLAKVLDKHGYRKTYDVIRKPVHVQVH
jgi:hypothetical protein